MADIPTIDASTPVVITPPAQPTTYDKWWNSRTVIDGSDPTNVTVTATIDRYRVGVMNEVMLMTDDDARLSGVATTLTYTLDHVLQRASGQIIGDPADPLNSPQIQAALAAVAGALIQATATIGAAKGLT